MYVRKNKGELHFHRCPNCKNRWLCHIDCGHQGEMEFGGCGYCRIGAIPLTEEMEKRLAPKKV